MDMTVGSRIRQARRVRGLQQAGLAREVGTTPSAVSQWEGFTREPSAENLRKLSRSLDVSADWLLGLDEAGGP